MNCPKCDTEMKSHAYTHVYADGSAERVEVHRCVVCGTRVETKRESVSIKAAR